MDTKSRDQSYPERREIYLRGGGYSAGSSAHGGTPFDLRIFQE